ncbi:MAG TPA: hypothetical protein VL527_16545 [Dongiaceae bacterium]|jgi:hypothetical protein|nr:hypothetical protein [Dongiaceae bacterium]
MKPTHPTSPHSRITFGLVCSALALALAPQTRAATTINFDGAGLSQNNNMPQTYGDFVSADGPGIAVSLGASVSGTPNVDLSWGSGVAHSVDWYDGWDGRGAVAQLDYNLANPISITFTPAAGWSVVIDSFDLDAWSGGGNMDVAWSISDISGTLASSTWARSTGGRDSILTGIDINNLHAGQAVTLTFQGITGDGSYFGVDNIAFDQIPAAVPEPLSSTLLVLGGVLGGIRILRWRNR